MENNEVQDKINQLPVSRDSVKNDDLSDKTDLLQMHINSLKICKCAPEENLLSGSRWAQVAENQTKALTVRLTE